MSDTSSALSIEEATQFIVPVVVTIHERGVVEYAKVVLCLNGQTWTATLAVPGWAALFLTTNGWPTVGAFGRWSPYHCAINMVHHDTAEAALADALSTEQIADRCN